MAGTIQRKWIAVNSYAVPGHIMRPVSNPVEILERAEADLASLAAQAAARQAYGEAARLLKLAEGVARLRHDPNGTGADPPRMNGLPAASRLRTREIKSGAKRAGRTSHGVPKADSYPMFRRDGEEIVKVGRSKAAGQTYEHRSPLAVLRRLCEAALEHADFRHQFSTEELFPLRDRDGRELPSYQGYLCLAWLRRTGLIRADGRAKYVIPSAATLLQAVDDALAKVPAC